MRKFLLVFLLLSFVITAKAQQNNKTANNPGNPQNANQQTLPQPPGGIDALMKYMTKYANHQYNSADAGKVTLSFVVEKDGNLTGYKVTHSLNAEADGIAIQVLKGYNKTWKPAMKNGQPVSVPYTISVPFGKD